MYEAFYGLNEKPFSLIPDPAFLYRSEKHAIALSLFEYSLSEQAGFCVVTGEVGAGKTTLVRHFLQNFGLQTTIGIISNPHPGFGELLDWVAYAFDIKIPQNDKVAAYREFVEFLALQHHEGLRTVLVVDEAQNLTPELLEQLRLLSNVNTDKHQLLQMILVGQPELLDKLKKPELRQFAQRVSVHYHLTPLTLQETRSYIRHRLAIAGATDDVFGDLALACVHYFTAGVPRLINAVCDMALVYGFAAETPQISWETVAEVAKDREVGSLLTLPHPVGSMTRDELRAELIRLAGDTINEESLVPGDPVIPFASAKKRAASAAPAAKINGTNSLESFAAQRDEDDVPPSPQIQYARPSEDLSRTVTEPDEPHPLAAIPLTAEREFAATPKLLRAKPNPEIAAAPRARKWSLWKLT